MDDSSKVKFHRAESLKERKPLKRFLLSIFRKEKRILASLDYIFCSDDELLDINREFLAHNYYTDVITFNLSKSKKIAGEIYISIDRVRENAKNYQVTLREELHRVIFHGALHLCGYDDRDAASQQVIRGKEDYYLSHYLK